MGDDRTQTGSTGTGDHADRVDPAAAAAPGPGPGGDLFALDQALDEMAHAAEILAERLPRVPEGERRRVYRALERCRATLAAVDVAYLTAGRREELRFPPRVVRDLADEVHVSHGEARRRYRTARLLQGAIEEGPDGHTLPAIARLVAAGEIGADAVENLHRSIARLPLAARYRVREVEEPIAWVCRNARVDELADMTGMLRFLLGVEDTVGDGARRARRSLSISRPDRHNMCALRGTITPQFAAVLRGLAADHARPGGMLPGELVEGDRRTPAQRLHDAVLAAVEGGYRRGGPLRPGRGTTTVVAVMTVAELAARAGVALTDVGTTMSVTEAMERADFRDLHIGVLDLEGRPLALYRGRRCASLAQYLMLCAEEGGTVAARASAPPRYCEIHHIVPWAMGGPTNLGNLTLLDRRTHSLVDDSRTDPGRYWTVPSDEPEKAWVFPPDYLDPLRRPRANESPGAYRAPGRRIRRCRIGLAEIIGDWERARRRARAREAAGEPPGPPPEAPPPRNRVADPPAPDPGPPAHPPAFPREELDALLGFGPRRDPAPPGAEEGPAEPGGFDGPMSIDEDAVPDAPGDPG